MAQARAIVGRLAGALATVGTIIEETVALKAECKRKYGR